MVIVTHESYDSVLVGTGKQKGLESLSENREWRRRCDVERQVVPDGGTRYRKRPPADCRETNGRNVQTMWGRRPQPSSGCNVGNTDETCLVKTFTKLNSTAASYWRRLARSVYKRRPRCSCLRWWRSVSVVPKLVAELAFICARDSHARSHPVCPYCIAGRRYFERRLQLPCAYILQSRMLPWSCF